MAKKKGNTRILCVRSDRKFDWVIRNGCVAHKHTHTHRAQHTQNHRSTHVVHTRNFIRSLFRLGFKVADVKNSFLFVWCHKIYVCRQTQATQRSTEQRTKGDDIFYWQINRTDLFSFYQQIHAAAKTNVIFIFLYFFLPFSILSSFCHLASAIYVYVCALCSIEIKPRVCVEIHAVPIAVNGVFIRCFALPTDRKANENAIRIEFGITRAKSMRRHLSSVPSLFYM